MDVSKAFRKHGFSLTSEAGAFLASWPHLTPSLLQQLLSSLPNLSLPQSLVDKPTLERLLMHTETDTINTGKGIEIFELFDAFEHPKVAYDVNKKGFEELPQAVLHAHGRSRSMMLKQRWSLLYHCYMRRHEEKGKGKADRNTAVPLVPIEALAGSSGKQTILGVLSLSSNGVPQLEDANASVLLDLSSALTEEKGFLVEGGIFLVEGTMEKDTFTARSIRFPPVLHRAMAVQTFPAHLGLFGEYSSTRMEQFRKEVDEKGVMIFVSDVALDVEKTTQLLAELFTGFEMALVGHSGPPPIFVLIGNFSSSSNGSRLSLVDGFNQLSRLLQRCPRLISTCKFVLVPGPNDPGPGFASCPVLPRPPLPPSLVQPLAAVASVQVATNPCRIRYGSQEIVIFREDLSKKLRRHTVNVDMQTNENTQADILPEQKALYTVMGQAHLCPLQQDVRPVYYQYDHALRLFPLPDVLVLAERGRQHSTTIKGCLTLNPGSFALTSDFMVYRPSKRAAELSRVKQ